MSTLQNGLLVITQGDSVAVALSELKSGESCLVGERSVRLLNDIPFGHKVALRDIQEGENIVKYGYPISHASCAIKTGQHVHTHNTRTNLEGLLEYSYQPDDAAFQEFERREESTFDGYLRPDGRAGIRNEVWIIPTVGCVNSTATILADMAQKAYVGRCDGIYAYPHNAGCSQLGSDHETTQRLLAGIINNPNAGGVLVLSLGCENNNLDAFKPFLGEYDENRVKFLVTQDVDDEYMVGLQLLDQLTMYASSYKRTPLSASHLVLGLKCGGSDAFSGITANALCGCVNDRIVRNGGSTILTEVPEMFGAETLLMSRCVDRETFDRTVSLIDNYKNYFIRHGQSICENPSPGNKQGGISTLEEKSMGCVQKGGRAPVVGVLDYGEYVRKSGLNLLTGSGNDQVSTTNLVASGANMVLFTTGRGNPYGTAVPTVKISSNTRLANRKPCWIDYNAGQILEGKSVEEVSNDFFTYLLDIASGRSKTQNEKYSYRDISIFRDGIIL